MLILMLYRWAGRNGKRKMRREQLQRLTQTRTRVGGGYIVWDSHSIVKYYIHIKLVNSHEIDPTAEKLLIRAGTKLFGYSLQYLLVISKYNRRNNNIGVYRVVSK